MVEVLTRAAWAVAVDRWFTCVILIVIAVCLALPALLAAPGQRPTWQLVLGVLLVVLAIASGAMHRAPNALRFEADALVIGYDRGEAKSVPYASIQSVRSTRYLTLTTTSEEINLGARWQDASGQTLSMSAVAEKINAKRK